MDFRLSAAQARLRARAREFATEVATPLAADVDRDEAYPWATVQALLREGFLGLTVPREYGGAGRPLIDAILVVEELAHACGVTGRIAVEANMGAVSAVMRFGTEEQKRLVADAILSGDKPAICITEPAAGSAASEMATRADRRGGTFVLNGTKHWITGGGVSRVHLIFARVFDERGVEEGIGGFLVVRDGAPGLRIGRREPTMGLRGLLETEVILEDLEVPASSVVVGPRGLRHGFADLMSAYNCQRVGAAAVALGIADGAFHLALAYSQEREQFGRPI